jgi:hypothetical protein
MEMKTLSVDGLLGFKSEKAIRIAKLAIALSLPMWIGALGFLSFLDYVPVLHGLGLHRLAGFFGFFGFSGFLGLLGHAAMVDRREAIQRPS